MKSPISFPSYLQLRGRRPSGQASCAPKAGTPQTAKLGRERAGEGGWGRFAGQPVRSCKWPLRAAVTASLVASLAWLALLAPNASAGAGDRTLLLVTPAGGETLRGTATVTWQALGVSWAGSDTVRLDYSPDRGASWTNVAGASALPYATNSFNWDTTTAPSGRGYLLRAVWNQGSNVLDVTPGVFTVHNAGLLYYVNDASTANDLWCEAPGNDANDGWSAASPAPRPAFSSTRPIPGQPTSA